MTPTQKHLYTNWEVSIMEIKSDNQIIYKVTRRLAEMSVAETKMFLLKEEAIIQFQEWLK